MNLTYRKEGDYLIPNLVSPNQPAGQIGHYGQMREALLKKHKPGTYSQMILSGTLTDHLIEIQHAAEKRMDMILPALARQSGATEELKARDPMKWVEIMNGCKAQAEEVIRVELIYN